MRIFNFRDRRPLTKHELVVVVLVICATALFVIKRVERLAAESERTAMILTVRSLRHAVMAQAMRYVVEGRDEDLAAMIGANPMDYSTPPKNYVGLKSGVEDPGLWAGIWYFDPERHVLAYRAAAEKYFKSSAQIPHTALFTVRSGGEKDQLPEFVVITPFAWDMDGG